MIIRRRRNSGFTIIGNVVFDDDRLSYEAAGLLGYLLSRPDHWEVNQTQLGDRRGVGRDRMRRIVGELIEAGYMRRERIRNESSGTFNGSTYLVYDEPQKADPEEVEDDHRATENPAVGSSGGRENRPPENPSSAIYTEVVRTESSANTEEKTGAGARAEGRAHSGLRGAPPPPPDPDFAADLEAFKSTWPNWAVDDEDLATRALQGLSGSDRKEGIEAIPAYIVFHRKLRGPKAPLPHANKYLGQMKWKRMLAAEQVPAAPAVATAQEIAAAMCEPFSKRLFGALFNSLRLGLIYRARQHIDACLLGRNSYAAKEAIPSEQQLAAMVELNPKSPEYEGWRNHVFSLHKLWLPMPDRSQRVWVPTRSPPAAADRTAEEELTL